MAATTRVQVFARAPISGTAKTRLRRAKQLLEAELRALEGGLVRLDPTGTRLDTWARELKDDLFEG